MVVGSPDYRPAGLHWDLFMDTEANSWKEVFAAWPAEMPRRAIAITAWDEQIPFSGFRTGDALLLLERATPDALGARMVILPYDQIVAVKLTEVAKSRSLRSLGFQGVSGGD
jgi:hypothetical protein